MKAARKRVRDAKRVEKETGKAYKEANDKVQAVLKATEVEALRVFNEAIAPFFKTYRITTSVAFKKAQDEGIRIQNTLGVRENEAYKSRLQAEQELRELKEGEK